jgi:hypothetical protein
LKVVHGSFQRLILTTGKRHFEDADLYMKYVLEQVAKDPMFRELQVETGEYWRILLFKDIYNHAGIVESSPDKLF